jgi:actin related protein 2/3 complex subunit 1A/1B
MHNRVRHRQSSVYCLCHKPLIFFIQGGGWIHSVSFSADGLKLAWVGHDSSISVADASGHIHKLNIDHLPLLCCIWISPNSIVAGGHSCSPMLFNLNNSGQLSFVSKLEDDKKVESTSILSAKVMFQTRDRMGTSDVDDSVLSTTHQNQVFFLKKQDRKVFQ